MATFLFKRIISDASNLDTFQNLLPQYKFKKQGRAYRAGRNGGVYLKENRDGILTANFPNGDYTGGNVLSITAQVFNLDVKTSEGFKTACIEVCKAAGLNFDSYCTDALGDYTPQATPSVSKPVETKVFLPNAGQPLSKSYSIDFAKENAPEHLAAAQYLEPKTGIPTEKQKAFGFLPISSRVHVERNRKEVFTPQNFAFAIVPSTLQHSIKIKNPTAKDKAFKVLFAQNTGNFLYGIDQLPTIDQRQDKVLFIVEGEEKAACINYNLGEYGFYAITQGGIFNGAYYPFFDVLRGQFKSVITWYDFDSGKGAGQKAAQRLYDEHGLNYVKHELYANDCKDINDIFVKHGKAFLLDIARLEVARLTMVEAAKTAAEKRAENITIQANKGEYIANILPQSGIDLTAESLNNTLLHGGTGTGKSKMTEFFNGKRIVVCHTTTLCENYIKNGARIFNGNLKEVSNDCEYYATTYKSLPNLMQRINPSEFFLFKDETQLHTTGASKDFMLPELSQCLDLESQFKGVCHMTGTPIYSFDERLKNLRTIKVTVPRNDRLYNLIEYKKELPTIVEKINNSIKNGRFPIVLYNDKGRNLDILKSLLKTEKITYLNSDTKKEDFFKKLTKTGFIDTDTTKGIITTSVFTAGNDIFNELDFDFFVCGDFHSLEIEQFTSRPRRPLSINISILKGANRKKIETDFDVNKCAEIILQQSERRAQELNNTPIEYRPLDERASLNSYAIVSDGEGNYQVNKLLLGNLVFRQERQIEYANDSYQAENLKQYGIFRIENEKSKAVFTNEEKQTVGQIKAENKAKKEAEFNEGITNIEAAFILAESENEVTELLETMKQGDNEGAKFAANSFERLTGAGIDPMKVKNLITDKQVTNESKLNSLDKSIAIAQLRDSGEYLKLGNIPALQIISVQDRINVGERYTVARLKNVMCDTLRIEKGFNKKRFDTLTTSHDVLDFTRLYFDITKDKHGFYRIDNATFFNEYYIEPKSKKVACNLMIIN
jgi:hypothetical protein